MKCPNCQTDNLRVVKFCKKCGHPFQIELVCSKCGHTNTPDSEFCIECGQSLAEPSPEPQPPKPPSMTVRSADEFPGAENEPLVYPGRRPDFPYVYYQGKIYEITPRGDANTDLCLDDSTGQITLDDFLVARGNATMDQRHAVLAVGSNGCPGRLAEKYAHQLEVAIPVFVGHLINTAIVYSRQLTPYGVLPATYLYQPGVISWLSVTMLTDEQLARMDETEDVGNHYKHIKVPGYFRVKDGPMIPDLMAYLDPKILTYQSKPVRLKMFKHRVTDWPFKDEQEVMSLVFDQAGLLRDETIEIRHKQLLTDRALREQLAEFLDTHMSTLAVDEQGLLVERRRPSIACSHVLATAERPGSEGTYIVRLSHANKERLHVKNKRYLQIRYDNTSIMARLIVDKTMRDETVRMDQKVRTAIGVEAIMQGLKKKEVSYSPDRDGELKYPIVIRRSKFRGPNPIIKMFKQQYLICVVHNAMPTDMETPLVRLTTRAMQVLGIEPGDKVFLISEKARKKFRCLPLDPKSQLPFEEMGKTFADWKYTLPDDPDLHLPWITLDLQARLDLDVQPWQPIIVGRDPYHALSKEYSQVALAVALSAVGGAIVIEYVPGQLAILLAGLFIVAILIWRKIRSRI